MIVDEEFESFENYDEIDENVKIKDLENYIFSCLISLESKESNFDFKC